MSDCTPVQVTPDMVTLLRPTPEGARVRELMELYCQYTESVITYDQWEAFLGQPSSGYDPHLAARCLDDRIAEMVQPDDRPPGAV